MKICSFCKECKPFTEFYRDNANKDGHEYRCRACKNATRKARRDANPEPTRERAREWYRTNRERVLAMQKLKRAVINEATKEERERLKAERHAQALANTKAKQPEYAKRYRTKNADRLKVMRKEKYDREANTKRIAEYRKKYPDSWKNYMSKWRKENAEAHAKHTQEWREKYPERAERSKLASSLRVELGVEPPDDLIDLILAKRKLDRAIKEKKHGTK